MGVPPVFNEINKKKKPPVFGNIQGQGYGLYQSRAATLVPPLGPHPINPHPTPRSRLTPCYHSANLESPPGTTRVSVTYISTMKRRYRIYFVFTNEYGVCYIVVGVSQQYLVCRSNMCESKGRLGPQSRTLVEPHARHTLQAHTQREGQLMPQLSLET